MASNRKIVWAGLLLAVGSAQAGPVPTIGDLDRVQAEIIMAEARKQLAEAQQALAKLRGDAPSEKEATAPVVTGVYGTAKDPYARFLMADGGQMVGRAGDTLPGSYKVVHVSVEKVVIADARGHKRVARFSRSAPTAATSSETGAVSPVQGVASGARPAGVP